MSKQEVERFLTDGGSDKAMRIKYDAVDAMDAFVALAAENGYAFTSDELLKVLQADGDTFERAGNPPCRQIWWT